MLRGGGYVPEQIEARRRQVVELTQQGWSADDIATELGVTSRTVVRDRIATGTAKSPPRLLTTQQWALAERLLIEEGCSYSEVARSIGCSIQAVSRRYPGYGWTKDDLGQYLSLLRNARKVLPDI